MAQQLAGFPKELESHLTDRLDPIFLISFWGNFIIWFGLFGYLQTLPPREISEEELKKYMRAIYSVKKETVVKQQKEAVSTTAGQTMQKEDIKTETATQKAERRAESRAKRRAAMAAAREAARSHGIFAAAGAMQSGGGGARGRGARGGRGLSGGLGGVDVGQLRGMATTDADVAAVERLRGGGAIMEGGGDIDVSQLTIQDLKLILEQSQVEVEDIPEVEGLGGGGAAASRTGQDIMQVVNRENRRLINCYNTQKKKDPNLRGKIQVHYTINADGSVSGIKIKNAKWNNPSLGRSVERCIEQRVARWRFGPAEGDVNTNFTLNFI